MTDPLGKADAPLPAVAGAALDVLAEAAAYLATGIDSDEAKAAVAGALKRGLKLARCRLWVRSPDGSPFRSIGAPGEPLPSDQEAQDNLRWLDGGVLVSGAP